MTTGEQKLEAALEASNGTLASSKVRGAVTAETARATTPEVICISDTTSDSKEMGVSDKEGGQPRAKATKVTAQEGGMAHPDPPEAGTIATKGRKG